MESRGKDRLDIEEERKEGCRKLWFDRAGNGRLVSLDYVVRCVFKDIQWSTITEYIHFMVPSFFQGLYLEWRIDPRWESSRDKKKGHVAANMQSVGQQETEMNPISFYISRFVVPTEWNWANWLVAAGLITDRYLS